MGRVDVAISVCRLQRVNCLSVSVDHRSRSVTPLPQGPLWRIGCYVIWL